jgi:hypothetical protein
MSRKKGTTFWREIAISCLKTPLSLSEMRRYFLYTSGKIGLTLCLLFSLFDAVNELGKLEQICHTKGRTTSGKHHTGIRGGKTCPSRRQCPDPIRSHVKRDAIFPPVVPIAENFKLLSIQRMEGMGDGENSFCERWSWCS